MAKHRAISSREFYKALEAADIVREADKVRRLVIVADFNSALVLYVERFGDERLLDLIPSAVAGIEVREAKAEDAKSSV